MKLKVLGWTLGVAAFLFLGIGSEFLMRDGTREPGYIDFKEDRELIGKTKTEVIEIYGQPIIVDDCEHVYPFPEEKTIQGDLNSGCSDVIVYVEVEFRSWIPKLSRTAHYWIALNEDEAVLAVIKDVK